MKTGLAIPTIVGLALGISLLLLLPCDPAKAQRNTESYQPGEQVEIRRGRDWKKATVIRVNRTTGWVEVRLDDAEAPANLPRVARDAMLSTTVTPDSIRKSSAAKAPAARTYPVRTWTDSTGKFNVEGQYARTEGANVVLKRSDGTEIQVPLDRLSAIDAGYVQGLSDASENPFQPATPVTSSIGLSPANWRDVKTIRPQKFPKWTFAPQADRQQPPGSANLPGDVHVTLADLPNSDYFFEKTSGVFVSADGGLAIVARTEGSVHQDGRQHLESLDLVQGKSIGVAALPPETALLDVMPELNLLMYRPEVFGSGEKTVLTIAKVDKQEVTPIAQWEPYAHESFAPSRDIERAWFLSRDKILTLNGHGKALTIWDVAKSTALLNIPIANAIGLEASLSPDRKLLSIVMGDGIAIIDLASGQHVATIPNDGIKFQNVAFRQDNARLAALSDHGLTIWNLSTGEMHREMGHSVITNGGKLLWTGDFVLLNSRYLFDPDRRVLLWEYQQESAGRESSSFRAGRLCIATQDIREGKSTFLAVSIPQSAVIEKVKELPTAEELLIVKPGDRVAIEVEIDPGIARPEEIREWFSKQAASASRNGKRSNIVMIGNSGGESDLVRQSIADALTVAGLQVVEKSDLVVKAICKQQPSQTVRINLRGRGLARNQDVVERTITPHASYLEMSLGGEVIWKRGTIARPGFTFFIQEGESLDDALTRLTRPNLNVFRDAKFSATVARPGKATSNGAYGVSRLTSKGLVEGSAREQDGETF